MTKPTQEQSEELNRVYDAAERAFTQARVFSNQFHCSMSTVERRFISGFLFGRALTDCFLSMDSGSLVKKVSKDLADKASALHNDISNTVVQAYCFTDADSTMCPCNASDLGDLDVRPALLDGLEVSHLSDALLPCVDLLIAIATIEGDPQALETAQRIKRALTC